MSVGLVEEANYGSAGTVRPSRLQLHSPTGRRVRQVLQRALQESCADDGVALQLSSRRLSMMVGSPEGLRYAMVGSPEGLRYDDGRQP
jgi:hypothetical protein